MHVFPERKMALIPFFSEALHALVFTVNMKLNYCDGESWFGSSQNSKPLSDMALGHRSVIQFPPYGANRTVLFPFSMKWLQRTDRPLKA